MKESQLKETGSSGNLVITIQGLKSIASHQYSAGGYTPIDKLMTPFWNWAASLLPENLHPNSITLIGTLALVVGNLAWSLHAPDFQVDAHPPSWLYLLSVACMFWSQTMDAIDGKQARRTGASSPLGQLFDHGCDAFSVASVAQMLAGALNLGPNWRTGYIFVAQAVMFWISTVVEYHTGTLPTNDGLMGVTEGQFMMMAVQIVSLVFGPQFWTIDLLLGYEAKEWVGLVTPLNILLASVALQTVRYLIQMTWRIFQTYQSSEPKDWGHKTLGFGISLWHLSWCLAMAVLVGVWTEGLVAHHNATWIWGVRIVNSNVGMLFAWQTSALIVAHMAQEPVPFVFQAWVPCAIGCLNTTLGGPFVNEMNSAILFWIVFWYFSYVISVVNEISSHLKIDCFSMAYLKKK